MKTALNPALRKAAVLISALDAAQADALLEQMGPERAAKVRAAAMELDDVPVDETAAVIAEFVRGGGKDPRAQNAADASDEVELHLSPAAEQFAATAPQAAHAPTPSATDEPSFAFLHAAPAELLARTLSDEHPQTLALVIAHLPPRQAAAVLERLPPTLAADALARMARVAAVPRDVLHDIAQALHARLEPHLLGPTSLGNLSAVLGAVDPRAREKLLSSLARRDRNLVRELASTAGSEAGQTPASASSAEDEPHTAARAAPPEPPLSLTALAALPDAALLALLSAAPPQVVWLALLEADEAFLRRLTAQLAPADAAALRRKLNNPGPVRLRDIDAARGELGRLARRLEYL